MERHFCALIAFYCLARPATSLQAGDLAQIAGGSDDTGPCSCLAWNRVYKTRKVNCGEGWEYFPFTRGNDTLMEQAQDGLADQFCGDFFEKMTHTMCVNVGMVYLHGDQKNGQWCYVDKSCKKLHGGGLAGGAEENDHQTKWKFCDKDEDTMLRGKSPEALYKYAKTYNLDASFLIKMAYPTWPMHTFKDLEPFWRDGDKDNTMDIVSRGILAEHIDNGEPFIFQDNSTFSFEEYGMMSIPSYYVAVGREKMYKVEPNPNKNPAKLGTWFQLVCQRGCDK